jgi:von Willebrand factor type A domain-containing protein
MSLLDKDVSQLKTGSGYKFSATKIEQLGATEYTLATIVVDGSGSVSGFAKQLEDALKTIFKACDKSPRRDNLMLRLTQFASGLDELHGFKLLGSINEKDYDNILQIGGNTALFDAIDEAIQATTTYGKQLTSQEFLCNSIVVVVTDGENNTGTIMDASEIKKSLEKARRSENLESILLILVGVTNDDVNLNTYLTTVRDDAGFDQYVSIGKATPGKIAKLADFVSQSISSTSTALGSGAASTPLPPSQFVF